MLSPSRRIEGKVAQAQQTAGVLSKRPVFSTPLSKVSHLPSSFFFVLHVVLCLFRAY